MQPTWLIYEEVARRVLTDIKRVLGIESIEGKQSLRGFSGTAWEVDAKAWRDGADGFLVVEVRRHATSRLKQEHLAAFAYRIQDLGGAGGIIVSPLPLQKGAEFVAEHADIAHVQLFPESTAESYLAKFIGRRFLGETVTEALGLADSCEAEVIRGKPEGD